MYNAVSGETITYAYDSLNRIATAGGSGWGQQIQASIRLAT